MYPPAVRLFGRPELHLDGRHEFLAANQVDQFLAYLAFRGQWVPREALIFLFWPDRLDAVGRQYLRKLLHRARQEIGGVEAEGDRIRWLVPTDVQAWHEAMDAPDLQRALALVRGPLLEGLDVNVSETYGAWLEAERSQKQRRLSDAVVARCRELEGDAPHEAIELATALSALDPLDERAVQCRLRALAQAGREDALEPVFQAFADRLALEVGGEPLPETRALVQGAPPGSTVANAGPPALPGGPARVPRAWGSTSFVGRRSELGQLEERLAAALAGHGGVVSVEGEAGVGKTRLIEHFLSRLPPGPLAFAARCYERDLSAPLEPIRTALGDLHDAGPARRPEDLRFGTTEPRERGHAIRGLTARLLAAAVEHGGAILFIDDLQWADAATLEFLSYAANRVQDVPVLIVVSHRREDRHLLERWHAQLAERRAIRSVRLVRFDGEQTRTLVAQLFEGDEGELVPFAQYVHDESEGNPFYVLEYLRWLREHERMGAAIWNRIERTAVPESVRSLIWARYRALDDEARAVLDVAAVLGRGFEFDLLVRASERDPMALWATVEPLLASGVLVTLPDGTFALSHDKLRQTVYESLGPPVRRTLHGRVAAALDDAGAGAAELAHHYLRAEIWSDAYASLLAAATGAEAESAWEVALQAYQRVLGLLERLDDPDRKRFDVLQAMERLLDYMNRRSEWIDVIERLSALARRLDEPRLLAEAALKRMAMASMSGDTDGATAAFAEANAIFVKEGDAAAQARAYRDVAYLAWIRGDYLAVLDASAHAARIFERLGHRSALAATLENVSHAHRWLGDETEASRWAEASAVVYEEQGSTLAAYVRLDVRSWFHMRRGEDAAAAAVLEKLMPICLQLEDKRLVIETHMHLGKTYLKIGHVEAALQQFESAIRLGVVTGDPRHEGYASLGVGAIHERLGDPDAAERAYLSAARLFEASFAISGTAADAIGQCDALTLHGSVSRRRPERSEAARESLTAATNVLRRTGDPDRLSRVQMELGSLHWSSGAFEAAADAFDEAVELARRHGHVDREIAGLASLGVVYRDLGWTAKSIAFGRAAIDRMEDRDDPLGTAVLLTSVAASHEAAGETAPARDCLERSLALRRAAGDEVGAEATRVALARLACRADSEAV